MDQVLTRSRREARAGLNQAVHRHKPLSKDGIQERLFTTVFSGLVYPQIWEDPLIDMEAMAIKPDDHIIAIASGGCNVMSYLTATPRQVTAIDLNRAHIAFNRLKIAAVQHLPSYDAFYRFFALADHSDNLRAYETFLRPHLDEQTRKYWDTRNLLGRKRARYFTKGVYRRGLLGKFIKAGHVLAKLHGRDPAKILSATSIEEQRAIFDRELAPLFDKRYIRALMNAPAALFGLGIPPSQFKALKGDNRDMAEVLRARLEQLACGFDLKDNYFAWQAFGRRYARGGNGPLPPYLERENYETLRSMIDRVDVRHQSFTEALADAPEGSMDGYVLLDAQDWMTDEQLTALWMQIARTAAPGARVIFRTAGEESILPGRIPAAILARFAYDEAACREMTKRDRSSIYGGFHLYTLREAA
ncbi:MAG: DUF3419 family protein [Pseudomonadota bacterium]